VSDEQQQDSSNDGECPAQLWVLASHRAITMLDEAQAISAVEHLLVHPNANLPHHKRLVIHYDAVQVDLSGQNSLDFTDPHRSPGENWHHSFTTNLQFLLRTVQTHTSFQFDS
jgi:hypothetical protein